VKNIATLKKIYYQNYISKFNFANMSEEEASKTKLRCKSVSEVKSLIDIVIDREYRGLTIFDMTGETKNKQKVLDSKEAIRAKNLICKYIWGYSWEELKSKFGEEKNIKKYISFNSVLMRRLENGNNVIIYGGTNGPCGRTLVASIIIKEAIKMRLFTPDIISQTYGWVDFQTLTKDLRDDSKAAVHYRTADWLVVDSIYFPKGETDGQFAYRTNLQDPFFIYRLKNNLPTILVFQYDIRLKISPLYKTFGIGISNIVNNPRACRIPLSKREENE
jgi:hypothetical protein